MPFALTLSMVQRISCTVTAENVECHVPEAVLARLVKV